MIPSEYIFHRFVRLSYFLILLAGVGKTSLVNLIIKGSPIARPPQTIGCAVDVKVITPDPSMIT